MPHTATLTSFIDTLQGLEHTYARVKPHVNSKTGIIPWIKPIPTGYARDAFHIYMAKHPIVGTVNSLAALQANIKASSSAIGYTARQAQVLAACEALERWCCISQGTEYAERHTFNAIKDRAYTPDIIHGISAKQYASRDITNRKHGTGGGFIPEPLPPDQHLLWCPAFDLSDATWKFVPKASCYYGHHDDGHTYAIADSRGVAAGPSREFCIWNALLELIETDAAAIWNANALHMPAVNIHSFGNPLFKRLCKVHEELGRTLNILDVSMDIEGVRVFAAISSDAKTGNTIKGFGAHPDAGKALEKALKECCQMLPNVLKSDGDGFRVKDLRHNPQFQFASHFRPAPMPARSAEDYQKALAYTSIQEIVDALVEKNIRPLVIDVSRPELDLCVMRVMAIGMRSWFNRRGPGRLYDIPVHLGLRNTALLESQVYPVPVEN